MPLDPEMIIAVQLSRSCTSVRVFAFSRFVARFRVFARKCRAPPGPRHTHFLHSWYPWTRALSCFGALVALPGIANITWEGRSPCTCAWWHLQVRTNIFSEHNYFHPWILKKTCLFVKTTICQAFSTKRNNMCYLSRPRESTGFLLKQLLANPSIPRENIFFG